MYKRQDIGLYPENGQAQDSVLIGTTTFNKLVKSGYWTMASFRVSDPVGNTRYENTSTVGMKLYIENPLEDILAPSYNHDLTYEIVTEKFKTYNGVISGEDGTLDDNGIEMRALKLNFSHYDQNPVYGGGKFINIPNNQGEENYGRTAYSPALVDPERGFDNGTNSNKHFEAYLLLYDYLQSGYYSVTSGNSNDIAGNNATVYHVKDTADFIICVLYTSPSPRD